MSSAIAAARAAGRRRPAEAQTPVIVKVSSPSGQSRNTPSKVDQRLSSGETHAGTTPPWKRTVSTRLPNTRSTGMKPTVTSITASPMDAAAASARHRRPANSGHSATPGTSFTATPATAKSATPRPASKVAAHTAAPRRPAMSRFAWPSSNAWRVSGCQTAIAAPRAAPRGDHRPRAAAQPAAAHPVMRPSITKPRQIARKGPQPPAVCRMSPTARVGG